MDIGSKIIVVVLLLIPLIFLGIMIFEWVYPRTAGNKIAIDLKYRFNKAIVYLGGEKIEYEVDKWSDYEGEQIQIVTPEGKVYLLSSFYTILEGE